MFAKKNLKDRLTTIILAGLMSTSSIIPSITNVHAEEETTSHQTVFLFKEKNEDSGENTEFAKYFADGNIGFKFEYSIGNQSKTISKTYISDNAELHQTVGNKNYEFTTPEIQIEENSEGNTFAYRASIVPAQEKYNDYFLQYGENVAKTTTGNRAANIISYNIIKVNRNIRLYSLENSGEVFRLEDVTNYDKEQIRAAIYEANPELKVWNDNLKASDPSFELLQFDKKGVHTTFPIRTGWNIPQIRFGYFGDEDHNDRGLLRPIKPAPSFAKITYRWKDHRDFTDEFINNSEFSSVFSKEKIEENKALKVYNGPMENDYRLATKDTLSADTTTYSKAGVLNRANFDKNRSYYIVENEFPAGRTRGEDIELTLDDKKQLHILYKYEDGETVLEKTQWELPNSVIKESDLPKLQDNLEFKDTFSSYTITDNNNEIVRIVKRNTPVSPAERKVMVSVVYKLEDGSQAFAQDFEFETNQVIKESDLPPALPNMHFADEFTSYKVIDGENKIERTLAMNTAKSFITYNDANGITAGTEEIIKPIGSKITNDDLHAPEGTHLAEEVNHTVSENEDDNKFVALIEYNTVEIGVIYKKGEDVVKTEVINKKVKDVVTSEDLPALPNNMHFIDEFTGYTVAGKNDQITRLVDDDTATQVVVHVTYKDSDGKVVKEEDISKKIGEKVTDNDLTAPEGTHFTGDPTDYTVTEEGNKIERLVDYNEVTVKVVYKDKNGKEIKAEELKKKIGSNINESELPSTPDGMHFVDKFDGYIVTGKDDKIERVVEENESNDAIIKVVYKDKDGNIVKQEDLKKKVGDKITNQDLTAPDGMHVVGTVEYDITKKESSLDVHVEMNKTSGHISFIANIADGPRYNEFDVTFGEVLPKFAGIKVNGYDFVGFYKNAEMTDPVTFEEVVNDDMTIYVKYEANHELDFAKKYNTANKPSSKPADTGAAMYGFTFLCLSSLFAIVGYMVLLYKREKMD